MTANQTKAALQVTLAISETIRDLGEVPAGHLYAAMMTRGMTIQMFESIVDLLVRTKLVKRDGNHLLTWIGPRRKS